MTDTVKQRYKAWRATVEHTMHKWGCVRRGSPEDEKLAVEVQVHCADAMYQLAMAIDSLQRLPERTPDD